ncbi:glycosyltransferase family 4 protein [Streptomyces platensis]|uniref:glycosyltransferase family 4 protein n=1 Tax=Streptomyces platensis TaxID=58346 RepID=UPI002E15ED2D|nr:glycosyltransferase family 4 protein [Streptomyces platensis]WTI52044.1 glycosyltransferase family 4 protein [Streptomyces platensis]WUB82398.1 glycosyltransferase family 4 protein [Streptomyces platensis]
MPPYAHPSPPPAAPAPSASGPPGSGPPPLPRRIVFLARRDLGNPAAGGSELLVDRIAEGLSAHGHQVTLLCGGPPSTGLPAQGGTPTRGYRVVSAGGDAGHFLRVPRQLARRVGPCDLLVEVCNGMPYLAPLWHRGPTLCLVNHVHTDLWRLRCPGPAARLGRRLEHWALAGAHRRDLMVAVSGSTASALRGLGVDAGRIRLVYNGVAEPGPLAPKAAEPLFLAMGRLVEYKRIDLLLRLWERVRPVTGGRLVIVGDGPERARLTAMAGPGVTFTGHVSEERKHQLLCSAWLLLHPSLVEGWGLVVMEAAARRTPAVGFDIPGLRDSVEDGTTGLLARGESAFAAHWCTLALSARRRDALGRAAERRAARFRWSHTVQSFRAVAAEAALDPLPRR